MPNFKGLKYSTRFTATESVLAEDFDESFERSVWQYKTNHLEVQSANFVLLPPEPFRALHDQAHLGAELYGCAGSLENRYRVEVLGQIRVGDVQGPEQAGDFGGGHT